MQWFAYLIWGGVLLCVVAAVGCYLYARFSRRGETVSELSAPDQEQQPSQGQINQERWLQVVAQAAIDPGLLPEGADSRVQWASDVLGIQSEWLRGAECAMYPCLSFHNAIDSCVDFIAEKQQGLAPLRLVAVKPQGLELDETVYEASVVLCFAQPVEYCGHRMWRYSPVNVYWEWGYLPEQYQCRQLIYLAQAAGCEVVGVETDLKEIYELLEGIAIPPCVMGDEVASSWPVAAIADAGREVPGLAAGSLSAEQLQQRIVQAGWRLDTC